MQLIQITSIPLEYRLRITNAKLQLAEAGEQKDVSKRKAEKISGVGLPSVLGKEPDVRKPVTEAKEKDSGQTLNNSAGANLVDAKNVDDDDIAVKLAAQFDADVSAALPPDENFKSKLISEFKQLPPVNEYIEQHNRNAELLEKNKSRVNIKAESNRYDNILKTYRDMQRPLEYIPGKIEMEIITKPSVEIKYIGGFMYVPPSSDPNYEEPFFKTV